MTVAPALPVFCSLCWKHGKRDNCTDKPAVWQESMSAIPIPRQRTLFRPAALEAVIQEAKGSKFQAQLIGELVVCDTPCSNNGCIHNLPHRRTAACIKNQCDWNSYDRGEDITACCVPDVSGRADFKKTRLASA